jgi:hypothetical protein
MGGESKVGRRGGEGTELRRERQEEEEEEEEKGFLKEMFHYKKSKLKNISYV